MVATGSGVAGVLRDRRTWVLAGITALTVLVGWLVKEPCLERDWGGGSQFRDHCYSDVQALWETRGAGDGTWPYLETFNEYPVLTGLFMHAVGELAPHKGAYVATTHLILGAMAVATTLLLCGLIGPARRVLYWAAAPAVVLYTAYNWDVIAVFLAVAGLWAYQRERWLASGVLLGLGACAKLWPAFLLPALGLALWRKRGRLDRAGWAFGLGAVGTMAALNLPFYFANPHLFLETYRFQLSRGPNFESPWYAFGHLGREWHIPWLAALGERPWASPLSGALFLASLVASGWAAWTRRLDPIAAAALPIFTFLSFNTVFSLQYVLWALPLAILTGRSVGQRAALVVADLAVFVTLFAYFAISDVTSDATIFFPVVVAVLARAAAFAWCAASLVRQAWPARPRAAVRAPAAAKA